MHGDIRGHRAFRPQMAALAPLRGGAGRNGGVLADTLACNWNLAADYFPEAVQIVDFQHARSREDVEGLLWGGDGPGRA